jgi:hypothetical protein
MGAISKEEITGWDLAESFKEGSGSKRVVFLLLLMTTNPEL